MLRITEHQSVPGSSSIFLEGKLTGPWVPALQKTVRSISARGAPIDLDLSGLRFADPAGIALLQDFASQGIALRNASPFLHELITADSAL